MSSVGYREEGLAFVKEKDTTEEILIEDIFDYIHWQYSKFKQHMEYINHDLNEEIDRIVAEKLDVEEEWDRIFDDIYEDFQNSEFDFDSEDEYEDEYDVWSEILKDVFIKMIENKKRATE